MEFMQAVVLKDFGGPEVLELQRVPKPIPKGNQVLVQVYATSVNPVDYQTRRGDYSNLVQPPTIIGVDVSGVVEAIGDSVKDFEIGDEVYYSPPLFGKLGSYAQYHVADENIIAHKPTNLSHVEAACFPLAGGTAWDCLVARGKLQVGEAVLIHAGAGGVGSIAIQLAKAMGAYVFTTCSEKNVELVRQLGADFAIDYKSEDYVEVIRRETNANGVDLVLDTIGGDTIQRSPEVLRSFGRLVTVVDVASPQVLLDAWGKNLSIYFVFTPQYRDKLNRIRKLIERHQIRPILDSVQPWTNVVQVHKRLEEGGTRGKMVLQVLED